MRPSEMIHRRWRDFTDYSVIVNSQYYSGHEQTPKSPSGIRVIPLFPELKPYLKKWYIASSFKGDNDFLFTKNGKKPFSLAAWYDKEFHPLREELGLPYFTPHKIRKQFRPWLRKEGYSSVDIDRWLGWQDKHEMHRIYDKDTDFSHLRDKIQNTRAFPLDFGQIFGRMA